MPSSREYQHDRDHNLGNCPDGLQKANLNRYRREADRDNWEVDYEIRLLTRIRKQFGRNGETDEEFSKPCEPLNNA